MYIEETLDHDAYIERPAKKKTKKQHQDARIKGLNLRKIKPITENQKRAFDHFRNGKNLCLHGFAGTGKNKL